MRWFAALLAMLLLSCQPTPKELDTGLAGYDPNAVEKRRAECAARGGNFSKAGLSGGLICIEPTRDGGKACSAGSECEGMCLARSRSCAPIKPLYGCNEILTDNGSRSTICIE